MNVATLRSTYLDGYLGRTAGDTLPWTDTMAQNAITDALGDLWPDVGLRTTGTVATDGTTNLYTIPSSIQRISRITAELVAGGVTRVVDQVTSWRYFLDADPPTKVTLGTPLITLAGLSLRFDGFKPFALDGSDLPVRLENVVCWRAASLAYGMLAAQLANSQRMQALDSGRVVDEQGALGLAAYYQQRYQQAIRQDSGRVASAPRASRRRG